MSPARKTAAWRTFKFSAAPTTISAPLSCDASTTSPRAAGPVRTHDAGAGVATGGVLSAQLPHHFLGQHRHELRRRGRDPSSDTTDQRRWADWARGCTRVFRGLAAGGVLAGVTRRPVSVASRAGPAWT